MIGVVGVKLFLFFCLLHTPPAGHSILFAVGA